MTQALLLHPQDLLFCRDGRPIVPGEGAAAGSQIPCPQVVCGALRTALLKARGQLTEFSAKPEAIARVKTLSIRGPLLYATKDISLPMGRILPQGPLIPMPADVVGNKPKHGQPGTPQDRLAPEADLPGWKPPKDAPQAQALWPCMRQQRPPDPNDPQPKPGDGPLPRHWLSWPGFCTWAQGGIPQSTEVFTGSDLWESESRTQVGLTCDGAIAEDGMLFTTNYLRLRPDMALYVEVDGDDDGLAETGVLHLGGDRRLARWEQTAPVSWPSVDPGTCVGVALTPTILSAEEQRCPQAWKDHCLGLAVPGSDPVSGWDFEHQQPRPVRWALQAGSVWHLAASGKRESQLGMEADAGHGWVAYGTAPREPD